jgi:DNA-binding NarL/FixJ family response regulator
LFTIREVQIILLVLKGLTNKRVGIRLRISEQTVKNHLTVIYQKLEIKSRYQLQNIFNIIDK